MRNCCRAGLAGTSWTPQDCLAREATGSATVKRDKKEEAVPGTKAFRNTVGVPVSCTDKREHGPPPSL